MIYNNTKCNFENLRDGYSTKEILKYKERNLSKLNSTINDLQDITELQTLKSKITEIQRKLNKNKLTHRFGYLHHNYEGIDEQIIILCTHRNGGNKKTNWFNNTNFTYHAQKLINRIDKLIKIYLKLSTNPIKTINDYVNNIEGYDINNPQEESEYSKDYLVAINNYLRSKASADNVKEITNFISINLHKVSPRLNDPRNKFENVFYRLISLWHKIFKTPEVYEKLLVRYNTLSDEIKNRYTEDPISGDNFRNDDKVFVVYVFNGENNKIVDLLIKYDSFIEKFTITDAFLNNHLRTFSASDNGKRIIIF